MMVPGEQICHNKITAPVMDKPEEHCDLSPQKTCRHKTTLVPRLKPAKECTVVPKEVCHLKHKNTRVEQVPFKSLWCQDDPVLREPEVFTDTKGEPSELPSYQITTEVPADQILTELPEYETTTADLPTYRSTIDEELPSYAYNISDYDEIFYPEVEEVEAEAEVEDLEYDIRQEYDIFYEDI